jgi:uncharacterized protein
MLTGVLDANAVIGLAKGGVFDLLPSLYAPLYIPARVRQEVIQQGHGRAGVMELLQAAGSRITEVTPAPRIVQQFTAPSSLADREVLAVAREKGVDHILTDDGPLRRQALRHGLVSLRVPQVVVLMKHEGLVTEVKPVLDRMRQQGYGIADAVYLGALQAVGE